jgi:hypothetical protein
MPLCRDKTVLGTLPLLTHEVSKPHKAFTSPRASSSLAQAETFVQRQNTFVVPDKI